MRNEQSTHSMHTLNSKKFSHNSKNNHSWKIIRLPQQIQMFFNHNNYEVSSKIHSEGIHKSSQSPTSRRNETKTRILERRRMGQKSFTSFIIPNSAFLVTSPALICLLLVKSPLQVTPSSNCNHKQSHKRVIHKIFTRSKFLSSKGYSTENNVHNTWIHITLTEQQNQRLWSAHQTPCYKDTRGKITLTRSLEQSIKSTKSKFKTEKNSHKHKSYTKSKCIRYNFFQNMRDLHLQQSHKYRWLKIISNSYKSALQNQSLTI